MRRRASAPPRLALLLELVLVGLLLLVNFTRYEQGPVLLDLGSGHGVHLADALLGIPILLIPLICLALPKTWNPKPRLFLTNRTHVRILHDKRRLG